MHRVHTRTNMDKLKNAEVPGPKQLDGSSTPIDQQW